MKKNKATTNEQPLIERFEQYGIKNCAKCGKWPATYTPLELTELCDNCIQKAIVDYRVKQINGKQPF